MLKLAGEALSAHGVAVASLIGSPALKRDALAAFSTPVVDGGATALLVPLFGGASGAGGGGAAGLTLTQAHTAFLLEPALQPGIERQAAGRIARIGQTRPTRCVRLIVGGTIECKILAWQQMRLAEGASAAPQLSLNDFVQLVDGE
uniref:Helicase C-terminal domain-containing protein n=1 Tax=Chrysotila carterae TaxID=13221 RepID=A0A7S4F3F9_CHRCT